MMLSVKIRGANSMVASGNMGSEKRRNPYPPNFRSTPARITEPAVGASTWASGSHVCTGHMGSLTANEAKKASHSQVCMSAEKRYSIKAGISAVPAVKYMVRMASSISTEPVSV